MNARPSLELKRLRQHYLSGATRTRAARLSSLTQFEKMVRENEESLLQALKQDLGKCRQEALMSEIAVVLDEIKFAKASLADWMRPQPARTPLALLPAKSYRVAEPLGVVLNISPWNFPVQLALVPLVSALAAGNCAVLKPSEVSVHTSRVLADLIARYFAPDLLQVQLGGVTETTELLKEKWDFIFFTGGPRVGRIVAAAAAQHLTPVTLELGGKSPAIVHPSADLNMAAKKIVWGKFLNAGQVCVAPDYVYVHESQIETLLSEMKTWIERFYGADPQKSPDFGRLINAAHFSRLEKLKASGPILFGGRSEARDLFIEPTLMGPVTWSSPVMQEEIFGPLLPLLTYRSIDDVYSTLAGRDKPLAAYFFATESSAIAAFTERLSFGGGCVNDSVLHFGTVHMPIGGVGESGYGRYHGESGFQTFSHHKGIVHKSRFLDVAIRYPPFSPLKLKLIRWLFGL